jgi:hypothetical protein
VDSGSGVNSGGGAERGGLDGGVPDNCGGAESAAGPSAVAWWRARVGRSAGGAAGRSGVVAGQSGAAARGRSGGAKNGSGAAHGGRLDAVLKDLVVTEAACVALVVGVVGVA